MLPSLGQKQEERINYDSHDSCLNNQVEGKTFTRMSCMQRSLCGDQS